MDEHEERPHVSDQMRVSKAPWYRSALPTAGRLRPRYAAARSFCSSPLDVAGSNPAVVIGRYSSVGKSTNSEDVGSNPTPLRTDGRVVKGAGLRIQFQGGSRALPKKCPSLKAMLDSPVPCAALERMERPASVLRIMLCMATAHEHPSPLRIGTATPQVLRQ